MLQFILCNSPLYVKHLLFKDQSMNILKKLSLSALLITVCLPSLGNTQEDFEKALSQMTPEQQAELFKEAQEQMRTVAKTSSRIAGFISIDQRKVEKNKRATFSKQVQKIRNATYIDEQKNSLFKMLPNLISLAIKSGATVELSGGPVAEDDLANLASSCQNPDTADIIIIVLELSKTKQTLE